MSELVRIDERVPAGERIDFYRDMCAGTWVPMDVSFDRACERADADVSGEFRASGVGALQVVVMDILPVSVRRTERHISKDAPDLLKAYLVCEGGPVVIAQGGRRAVLTAGDLAFYDTRRPYEGILGTDPVRPMQGMTFMFPPSLLPLSPSGIRELTATRIPATAGVGELTAQFLLQLARNVEHYTPAEAARLSSCALEVLATRLARELGICDWGTPEARRHATLTTVQGFIQQNLGNSGLIAGCGGRRAPHLAAHAASAVPRRRPHRGRVHPGPAARMLPAGPG